MKKGLLKGIYLVLMITLMTSCKIDNDAQNLDVSPISEQIAWDTTDNGLIFRIIKEGTGPKSSEGHKALIHETTQLKDGTMITDTWSMNFPIEFVVGGNQVIDGLDQAVNGMRVGERRKLIVPPSLSKRSTYPENGLFDPGDTLYYDVILLKTNPPEE